MKLHERLSKVELASTLSIATRRASLQTATENLQRDFAAVRQPRWQDAEEHPK
jgi:hypothetical protein